MLFEIDYKYPFTLDNQDEKIKLFKLQTKEWFDSFYYNHLNYLKDHYIY